MKSRWRTLVRPERSDPADTPGFDEALALWLLGVLWALACLWLAYLGSHDLLPGVLIAGLLALWGWRHVQWLWWFPSALVIASTLETVLPPDARGRLGALAYGDVLAIGVVAIALVRAIGLDRPLLPRTPVDRVMALALFSYAITTVAFMPHSDPYSEFRRLMVAGVVFYAAVTIALRPGGARWGWGAFPLATALTGTYLIWTSLRHVPLSDASLRAGEPMWGAAGGSWTLLLVALPLTAGLSVNAGHPVLKRLWSLVLAGGTIAAVLLVATQRIPALTLVCPTDVGGWVRAGLATAALLALAHVAGKVRRFRPHEAPRWLAVQGVCMLCVFAVFAQVALSGLALHLLAIAAGLAVGTLRSDLRSARRSAAGSRGAAAEAIAA